jgi:hypothetical protein
MTPPFSKKCYIPRACDELIGAISMPNSPTEFCLTDKPLDKILGGGSMKLTAVLGLAICASLTLSACGSPSKMGLKKTTIEDKSPDVINNTVIIPKTRAEAINLPKLVQVLSEDTRPQHYKVSFRWSGAGRYKVKINPLDNPVETSNKKSNTDSLYYGTVEEYFEIYNSPGVKRIAVDYFTLDGELLESHIQEVGIPTDIVIDRAMQIQDLEKAGITNSTIKHNRLFLGSNFAGLLNGNTLNIYTKKLIAKPGAKFLGSSSSPSSNGTGTSGGYIYISTTKAEGPLILDLRGQNGAPGANAEAWPAPAANGQKGKDGRAGISREVIEVGGKTRSQPAGADCAQNPTDGAPGANGQNGRDGAKGERGGDGGSFFVQISEESPEFIIKYALEGGLGGPGGMGGTGQLGGRGGEPGNPFGICTPAAKGTDGKAGLPGKQGSTGDKGRSGVLPPAAQLMFYKIEQLSK